MRGFLAGELKALEHVAAALAERADHGIAGAAERHGDVLALLGERRRDPIRAFVELRRDLVADVGNIVRQVEMHAGDGVADLLGLADQGVALMRQRLEQAADADLVVVVGTLKRRDLVGDQGFEFGRARKRAFDAVAHRRDLAADRLADRDHGIAGDLLRLGKPHGDVRHRLGDQAHLLGAPHQERHQIEEYDRPKHQAAEPDHGGQAGGALLQHRLQAGQINECECHAADRPGHSEYGRQDIRRLGRPLLQGLQNLTDGLAVVVGGELAGRAHIVIDVGGAGFELEQVLVRGGLGGGIDVADRLLCKPLLCEPLMDGPFGRSLGCRAVLGRCVGYVEHLLDGRHGIIRRIRQLFRVVRHVGRRLTRYAGHRLSLNELPLQAVLLIGPSMIPSNRPRQPGGAPQPQITTGRARVIHKIAHSTPGGWNDPILLDHRRKRDRKGFLIIVNWLRRGPAHHASLVANPYPVSILSRAMRRA